MDFSWRSFVFGFRLLLMFICVELLHYMFMICVLHELGMRLEFGFEHLVCNVWWTMLVCATLIYLCSSCGCEVVLTKLNFISYISCILYASISTCRENSVKIFKYICALGIHSNLYAHIKREFSLLIELGEFIHTIIWNFQEKWVSSSKVQFQVHLMPSV